MIADHAIAIASMTANSRKNRPTTPPMNSSGMNTASSEHVMLRIVKPISRAPSSDARSGERTGLDVARDVLGHDDRVVDDEPGRDRQRHQRQVVEAVVEQVHHAERRDQRERHDDAGDRGRAPRAQEDEHDEDHERDRDRHRLLDVVDRRADRERAIDADRHVDAGRDRRRELGHQRLDPIDHVEDVRARAGGG